MRIKQAMTDNIGVKIIALIVALIIWFNVSSEEQMTRLFTLPVKLVNLPDTLTIQGTFPKAVDASITATKRQMLYMGFKKGFVSINLASAAAGRFRQTIAASNVMLPSDISANDVRIITPTSIDLQFERKITMELPVALTLTGAIPEGYLLNGSPSVAPGTVEVTGGRSAVEPLRAIQSEPIDLSKIRDRFDKEVLLEYDPASIRCSPGKVKVLISVSQKGRRVLANVPPTILFDDRDLYAEIVPTTVSLTLEGPKAILDTLSSGDVSILLDLSGRRPGRYIIAPEVIVPAGLKNIGLDVESLGVDLRRIEPAKQRQ